VDNLLIRYQRIAPTRYLQEVSIPAEREGRRDPSKMSNNAFVITRQGELAGRSNVSNIHIPGVSDTDMEQGFLTAAFLAIAEVFADKTVEEIDVGFGSGKLVPCAFKRSNPAMSPQMVSAYTQDSVRVMRRRTVRVGS